MRCSRTRERLASIVSCHEGHILRLQGDRPKGDMKPDFLEWSEPDSDAYFHKRFRIIAGPLFIIATFRKLTQARKWWNNCYPGNITWMMDTEMAI